MSRKDSAPELYTFTGCVVGDMHGKAVKVSQVVGGNTQYWYVPLSQVKQFYPCKTKITVTAWIAKKNGWLS